MMADLISRAAALDAISTDGGCGMCARRVLDIPAVDVAQMVHGRWIEESDRTNHWHCSNCGFVEGIVSRFYNYCPNCGAKNVEE